jgi:hypothetical protein
VAYGRISDFGGKCGTCETFQCRGGKGSTILDGEEQSCRARWLSYRVFSDFLELHKRRTSWVYFLSSMANPWTLKG